MSLWLVRCPLGRGMGWCGLFGRIWGGIPPLSLGVCLVCVWSAGVKRAETLIGHYVFCKTNLNMKFGGVIHEDVVLLLAVISLDLELV